MWGDNVIPLGNVTTLDMPPDRILQQAIGEMSDVMVVGWDHDGELYVRTNFSDGGAVLWLLEKVRQELLKCTEDSNSFT